jgi:hypothetical protein
MNTCIALPLHKQSQNKMSQVHYFGVQIPRKLMWTSLYILNIMDELLAALFHSQEVSGLILVL